MPNPTSTLPPDRLSSTARSSAKRIGWLKGIRQISVPNLTAMSMNLFELLKGGNFIAYPDDEIKMAISRAVAKESSRGLKITKEKASHKIDVVVALAMAALGAMQQQVVERHYVLTYEDNYQVSPY